MNSKQLLGGKMRHKLINKKGFTLLEVVASLAIISIILLSFAQIFVQSNRVANSNNEKLIVTNLADAVLQRMQNTAFSTANFGDELHQLGNCNNSNYLQNISSEDIPLNNKNYVVKYTACQNSSIKNALNNEKNLNLVKITVTVKEKNGNTTGKTEGYVVLE
ncbi:prepilin-type N-terminal cleavage/methylation domain-containing protein [Solibacillus sp. FSL W8-0474]|uniref:prepilin-type N-terminal cleavage/methylation domain-containing protein n=1 Tax=Solibacillus sp. FSL W8-0474 TaxID=2975336 RepID=UPI0030FCCDBC